MGDYDDGANQPKRRKRSWLSILLWAAIVLLVLFVAGSLLTTAIAAFQ